MGLLSPSADRPHLLPRRRVAHSNPDVPHRRRDRRGCDLRHVHFSRRLDFARMTALLHEFFDARWRQWRDFPAIEVPQGRTRPDRVVMSYADLAAHSLAIG